MSTDVNPSAESARRIAASFEELRLPLSARARRDPVAFALDLLLLAIIRFLEHMGRELAENARLRAAGLLPPLPSSTLLEFSARSGPPSDVSRLDAAGRPGRVTGAAAHRSGAPVIVPAPASTPLGSVPPSAFHPGARHPGAREPGTPTPSHGRAKHRSDLPRAAASTATLPAFGSTAIATYRTAVAARASPRLVCLTLASPLRPPKRPANAVLCCA